MKKFLTILLAVVLCCSCMSLVACKKESSEPVVKVLAVELTNEQYAIGVNKDNPQLLADINGAMQALKDDGTYAEIYAKYTAEDYSEKKGQYAIEVATEFTDPTTQFAIATNAEFPPFEEKLGNKFVGLDIEFANEIAKKLNKTLVVINMLFDAVIPYVKQNVNVVAMAGLTVNDDRKTEINFTDSYIDATQVLIVKANDTTFDSILASDKTAEEKTAEVIEKINSLSAPKIGAQNGTTGYNFAKGNEAFEYEGFANAEVKGYTTGALAVQDLANGNIDMVILDKLPAQQIVKNINK